MKRFRCPFCGFTFEKIFALKQHVTKKHLQHISECPICNKKLKTRRIKSSLLQHFRYTNDYEHMSYYYLIHNYTYNRHNETSIAEGKKYKKHFSLD